MTAMGRMGQDDMSLGTALALLEGCAMSHGCTRNEIVTLLTLSCTAFLDVPGTRFTGYDDGTVIQGAAYTSLTVSTDRPFPPSLRVGSCIVAASVRPAIPRAELAVWSRVSNGQPCGVLGARPCSRGTVIVVTRPGWIRWDTCDGMPVDTFISGREAKARGAGRRQGDQ